MSSASSRSATASQGTRLPSSTLSQPKSPPRDRRGLCAPQARGVLDAGRPALLAALSFLCITNLSNPLFGDVLDALQTLARITGCLALPTPRGAFPPSSKKPPSHYASSLCSTNHRKRSRYRAAPSHWRGSRSASRAAVVAA